MLQGSGAMPTLVVEEGIVSFSSGKQRFGHNLGRLVCCLPLSPCSLSPGVSPPFLKL